MTNPQSTSALVLRHAIERLPRPNGQPEVRVTVSVPAGGRMPARATTHLREVATAVLFQRAVLVRPEGEEPVWVYEGALALDHAVTPTDRTAERVAQWIQEQLGPRCLAVDIRGVTDQDVSVRVAATVGRSRGEGSATP